MKLKTTKAIILLFLGISVQAADTNISTLQEEPKNHLNLIEKMGDSFYKSAVDSMNAKSASQKLRELKEEALSKKSTEALTEIHKMASKKNSDALRFLGYAYDSGIAGLEKNPETALKYYWKCAEIRDSLCIYNLGVMARYGRGMPANADLARKYFYKAAELGLQPAKMQLAMIAEEKKDSAESMKWYRSVTQRAIFDIAPYKAGRDMLINGTTTGARSEGVALLKDAADNGNPDAQVMLADINAKGLFVPQSTVQAAKWIEIARQNKRVTKAQLDALPRIQMTDSEFDTAVKVVNIWLGAHPQKTELFDFQKTFDTLSK